MDSYAVFIIWDECKQNVSGFKNAQYKKFKTKEEAETYMNEECKITNKIPKREKKEVITENKEIYHIFRWIMH